MPSRRLAAGVGALVAGALLVGAVAGAVGWVVGPYLMDDRALDGAVRVVAITWKDAGRDAAEEQLRYELDAAGIGPHVALEDCTLTDDDDMRGVRCAWDVEVTLPGTSVVLPLAFTSEAYLDDAGALR